MARRQLTPEFRDFFGEDLPGLDKKFFMGARVGFLGAVPNKIEIFKHRDGLQFADAYPRHVKTAIDHVPARLISLSDLKVNKRASGRNKDLADLDNLP